MGVNDEPPTPPAVTLRPVHDLDIPLFFRHQLDPEANHMAAFTAQDPADWAAFQARWMMMRANETTLIRTVLVGETVAGHVYLYEEMGRPEVSYWLGREVWGKGVATRALALFLRQVPVRPIYARVAQDNIASLRVLQKCGFRIIGHDQGFAAARQADVAEYILVREAA